MAFAVVAQRGQGKGELQLAEKKKERCLLKAFYKVPEPRGGVFEIEEVASGC